jgi:cobyrinic acid a,c-diamide synthase
MSLRQCSSLVGVIDRELSTKRMKIGKAPALLKKSVSMCKSKTSVLGARLLVLASFRRRVVMAGVISNKIQSLMVAAACRPGDGESG